MNRLPHVICVMLLLSSGLFAKTGRVPLATCLEHNISLNLQPSTRSATVTDSGSLECAAGWNLVYLADRATVDLVQLDGQAVMHELILSEGRENAPAELRNIIEQETLEPKVALLFFKAPKAGRSIFRMVFSAQFDDPVESVQFSREKVGNEVRGTILEQGAYLSSASCYYPQGAEKAARFSLSATLPAHWTAIADGNPLYNEVHGSTRTQGFTNPFLSDGYVFMAAPYYIKTTKVDDIVVATYFFAEDSSLCDKYLSATADYIRMYQEMIGPYPFSQFTVAENFFPTGYGMPGWTLLGQTVLKLPFIITSSLGHEVLHNWWGNSVYVDYARGNWCEAAAVYGADYHYKLLSFPADATAYRKDILKEYLSYVNGGNDFPLREFKSRSSAETRTIGYNKGMMVFHLIEQEIGTAPFFAAWKQIYADYRGKAISWEEWLAAFERTSGRKLDYVIPEWINRAGAPEIGLDILSATPSSNGMGKSVRLRLTQPGEQLYHLSVPVIALSDGGADSMTVNFAGPDTTIDFPVAPSAKVVAVDPDFHLFRKLYPQEVEPIISAVLGVEEQRFLTDAADQMERDGFAAFGEALAEDTVHLESIGSSAGADDQAAYVLFNPDTLPGYFSELVKVVPDSITLTGVTYPRTGRTFVLAGIGADQSKKNLVVFSRDSQSLARIGQLVPHYGKYSYLVFEGAKNTAKGQWPVTDSPLRKTLP